MASSQAALLELAQVDDDRPAVGYRNRVLVGRHQTETVGDGVEDLSVGHLTQAIIFGDIRDPQSAVVERKGRNRNYILLAELGNKPRTSYLARIRNPHPDLAEA